MPPSLLCYRAADKAEWAYVKNPAMAGFSYITPREYLLSLEQVFLAHRSNSLRAELEGYLLAVNHDSLRLKIWLPNFLRVALGKTDVVAVLLSFARDVAFLHKVSFDRLVSAAYCTGLYGVSQLSREALLAILNA